jgi:hypothetical protein
VTKTTLIVSLLALASGAYPSTISSFNISTSAFSAGVSSSNSLLYEWLRSWNRILLFKCRGH